MLLLSSYFPFWAPCTCDSGRRRCFPRRCPLLPENSVVEYEPESADDGPSWADPMNELIYRFAGYGCEVEVFDDRVVVLQVGRSQSRLSEEVSKLAELRERGVLSEDEFSAAKRRVIGPSA